MTQIMSCCVTRHRFYIRIVGIGVCQRDKAENETALGTLGTLRSISWYGGSHLGRNSTLLSNEDLINI